MRAVKLSLAACGLSTLCLGIVIANAIFAPLPAKTPQDASGGTTTIVKNTF